MCSGIGPTPRDGADDPHVPVVVVPRRAFSVSSHATRRRGLIGTLVAGLVASPLALGFTAAPASAASTTVVINEVYVNGGSTGAAFRSKFVELRNLTSSPVNLSGMSVQYRAPGSTGNSTGVAALTGTIPANGYYVVVGGSNSPNTGAEVPASPGQTSTGINPGGGGGTVTLVQGTSGVDPSSSAAVVDKLGYGNSNTPEGTAASGNSVTQSLGRSGASTDTDANAADFSAQAPSPGASNGGGAEPGGQLAATSPGNQSGVVGTAFSLPLAATGGTAPYTWTAAPLPAGLTLTGNTISGTPTTAGTTAVTATVTDSAAATSSTTFNIVVTAPGATLSIAEIQGTGDMTPYAGQQVTTEGVVTAAYPTGGLNGFYLQTGGPDTTPDASDGIFVYGGTTGFGTSTPAVGASVRVTGTANEFNTVTQITATPAGITALATPLPDPVFKTTIPGADCQLGSCPSTAEINAAREKVESEAFLPTADYTVTDVYDGSAYTGGSNSSAMFGEIGLAAHSDLPLFTPTDVVDALDTAAINARVAYNNAHRILLDDGSTTNYQTAANTGMPFPYFTADHTVRVGANIDFVQPQVLTYSFSAWRLQPQAQVTGVPAGVTIEQDRPAAPAEVGGDVKLATFNVLNYFPTLGATYTGGTCTRYNDRQGNGVTVNTCPGNGPRGAWDAANLKRQQDKIVDSINKLDADIVTLEEIENSRVVTGAGGNRDAAVSTLVNALNAAAGGTTPRWAFVASPATLPQASEEDVIRNAIIYDPSTVQLVGGSQILVDSAPFSNAREPFAQAFKATGDADADGFAVIVNHFKSKGSGTDDGTGQGLANPDRVNQANALVAFADTFADSRGVEKVFLTGDFNAYSFEDPVQAIEAAGYTNLDATTDPNKRSYNFDGQVGSLDHVFANEAAADAVSGVDVWTTNGYESVYYEYSRYNYNVTDLYAPGPFRASDHNPEIVGINTGDAPAAPVDVQILATNDFHGRIANDSSGTPAGAAVLAGAVKQFKAANPATSFVAAGDLIGASTFESFIADDKPTIDVLNEAGLDVSAVGNHEFDKGYDDLTDRVMAPYDAQTNPNGGAEWQYLGANVKFKGTNNPALEGSWIKDQGGIQVGYVGAVTEHLDELVAPAGIADIEATDIVAATNAAADELKAEGADVVVLLVHEGAASADCATITADTTSDFGKITAGVNTNVDAIVSGHTHLSYNCSLPVTTWADRPVKERPVVSAGQYGSNLNKINFSVDPATGTVQAKTQALLPLKTGQTANYPVDQPTKAIVDAAVARAEVLGAEVVGQIGGAFNRAKLADGTTENRGGESTLSNLVAEIQKTQTESATTGSAQIAFMNPGGLRADLVGNGTDASRDVTFKQAANVQPFANTLVNMDLTGAKIKEALEQQWQPTGASRPFLKLGISKGFSYTYDPSAAAGSRITGMYLDGEPVSLTTTYSVTVNSFLASGGDNFTALNGTGRKQDTGVTDLQAQVDYFDAQQGAVPVDYSQRAVGVTFPADAPETYPAGSSVTFDLSSLSMTGPGDTTDSAVTVSIDGTDLPGSFPVTTTKQTALPGFDEVGTAAVTVTLPATLPGGAHELLVKGATTGTEVQVPITVTAAPVVETTVTGTAADVVYGQAGSVEVTVTPASGDAAPTGTVTLSDGDTTLGTGTLTDGKATIAIPARALAVGDHELKIAYAGDTGFAASEGTVDVTVVKAATRIATSIVPAVVEVGKGTTRIVVAVRADGYQPSGTVQIRYGSVVIGAGTINAAGNAVVNLGPYPTVGTFPLVAVYLGDESAKAAAAGLSVRVTKQAPVVRVTAPKTVKKNARPTVRVAVSATNVPVAGPVRFQFNGRTVTRNVAANGTAQFQLPKLGKNTTVRVTYLGNAKVQAAVRTVTIKVKR
ncbi:ExeM/NucH family extracellular endonuclease [Nocardioides sp. C4-1]|uniref:ExeM/NucH family extracellular endonuclease n=1 Tax=Nocardioides sp. C4-1 TaxID=3151851 RepID=UPI003267C0B3